jgi:hypothetical protein
VHSCASRAQTSMQFFSCSVGHGPVSTKSASGHVTLNLCFVHPVGSAGHVAHSYAFRAQNIDALIGTKTS